MRHTRSITRTQPAKAQSAYASKLEFKQSAALLSAENFYLLSSNGGLALFSLLGNALSLGINFIIDFEEGTGGGES